MSDFEKSFQHLIDSAVEKAILKYSKQIQEVTLQEEFFFSIPTLAKCTGFSRNTIKNWIYRDYDPLPAYQVDKDYRISLPVFIKWFEKYKVGQSERKKKSIKMRDEK